MLLMALIMAVLGGCGETQYEIASNILEDKIPIDEIASTIGLKEEEIKKLL